VLVRSFTAALVASVVFCAAPAGAHAQSAAAAVPGAQVTGAAGFAFGTTRADIVAQRGTPAREQPDAEGVAAMMYPEQVLGRQMMAIFFVHPQMGLIRGGYMAPVSGAADCGIVIGLFNTVVGRRYPGLQAEERTVGNVTGDACAAALARSGGYMKAWTDPANGARILLTLLPGGEGPLLMYTTPEADAWERRKNDAKF
jgi:hypothetical protein